jgi:hypothetical protein
MPQNEPLANYSFLPWVRSGLGNEILETDTLGANLPTNPTLNRPQVTVVARVKASKGEETLEQALPPKITQIQGPGDVLGINQQQIIRVHPKRGVDNFETNNLCYVEFYEEDLPWRFTPAKPHASGKLRPWLALIVCRQDEFTRNTQGGTPTPTITLNPDSLAAVFYDEEDHYAMAHVHVLEDLGQNTGNEAAQLNAKLAQNPDLALSRLICPRKLDFRNPEEGETSIAANTYTAFVIPAFEVGRLAGLGQDTTNIPAQEPSWSRAAIANQTNQLQYPYYFSWSFAVGPNGDFETLAELLEPTSAAELPDSVGRRAMETREMGYDFEPTGSNTTAYVEGALKLPGYVTASWPQNDTDLRNKLRNLLNLSADLENAQVNQPAFSSSPNNPTFFSRADFGDDPIIVPPTYGKWHRGTVQLGNSNDWVNELNMHPGHRAAAGLGTRVVQENQEEFMEMAWEQIGEINEANQKIIENELAKRAAKAMLRHKLNRLDQVDLLGASGKAFERLKGTGGTLKKELKNSRIPTGMRSGTFTRIAINFTPSAHTQSESGNVSAEAILQPNLLDRINRDENDDAEVRISAAPKRENPVGVLSAPTVFTAIQAVVDNPSLTFMEHVAEAIKNTGSLNMSVASAMAQLPGSFTPSERQRAEHIFDAIQKPLRTINEDEASIEASLSSDDFEEYINTSFDEGIYRDVKFVKASRSADPLLFSQNALNTQRQAFRNEFGNLFINNSNLMTVTRQLAPAFDVVNLKTNIRQRLDPVHNFKRILQGYFAEPLLNQNKPLMAYPRFPLPMYTYLKDISADYIVPNIADIKANTVTLMKPNKKFIEAFLAGMNHEFSRELLWREFPTDMRGSYFRHFWEYDNAPGTDLRPGETVEDYTNRLLAYQNLKADIEELHNWGGKRLGQNHNGGPNLVLLIKGDLFKKYPNTLVYAQKAKYATEDNLAQRQLNLAQRQLDDYTDSNVEWPILRGQLEPDVYFFGFDLNEEQAAGNRSDNPGYFFVLRERPGQISFGLDDLDADKTLSPQPENWDEVTWQHITNDPQSAPPYLKISDTNLNLSSTGSGPRSAQWGAGAADMAYILYQSPVLFARHAATMLTDLTEP